MDIKKLKKVLSPSELEELERLLRVPTLPTFRDDRFTLQNAFIEDPALLKALLCTRRAGKSYAAGLYLLKTALHRKGTSSVYLGLTRDQAKRIVWDDVLKTIIKRHGIKAKFNETELNIEFPNGSRIYVLGVDDSQSQMDKLLGKKYALAVIDEAASYQIDLHNLVYKILKPALADHRGTLVLMGTPDDRKSGIFYDLTRDIPVQPPTNITREGWSVHTWSTSDNPYMREQWEETLRDLRRDNPHVEEQNWFRQHYLGQWVVDDNNKIYRYDSERNGWDGTLPEYRQGYWHKTLGIDLGFNDATALTLTAYHDLDTHVYILRSEKRRGLTITDTAAWIREWMSEDDIEAMVVDGASKQAVEEMIRHHGLPLQTADKRDKAAFIRIMNADFVSGKIRVDRKRCLDLIEEWDNLVWDRRALEKGIYREHFAYHGDCCDSALYAYRFNYALSSEVGTPEWEARQERERWDRELEEKRQNIEMLYAGSEYLFY